MHPPNITDTVRAGDMCSVAFQNLVKKSIFREKNVSVDAFCHSTKFESVISFHWRYFRNRGVSSLTSIAVTFVNNQSNL